MLGTVAAVLVIGFLLSWWMSSWDAKDEKEEAVMAEDEIVGEGMEDEDEEGDEDEDEDEDDASVDYREGYEAVHEAVGDLEESGMKGALAAIAQRAIVDDGISAKRFLKWCKEAALDAEEQA